MLNKKGQALIEFVLILPILIMLIFTVIDFGNIFVNKNELETALGIVNDIDKNSMTYDNIYNLVNAKRASEITVKLSEIENGYITVTLERKLDIITPGLNLIIGDPYVVSAFRVIKYE